MANPLEEWYRQLPVFTRLYTTAVVGLALALQLEWVTAFQLFHSSHNTFGRGQYWRVATTFLFLGGFSLDWMLKIYFIVRYCRDLEEGSYLNRPADFAWTVLLICGVLLALSPYLRTPFLGDLLVMALTYMWSRHYSHLFINFMGLFTTSAAYLPWVLIGFSLVIENRWPMEDVVAMCVGHVFWFLSEVWPLREESGGSRPLQAPRFLCRAFRQDTGEDHEADSGGDGGDGTHGAAPASPAGDGAPVTHDGAAAASDGPRSDSTAGPDKDDGAPGSDSEACGSTSAIRQGSMSPLRQRVVHTAPSDSHERAAPPSPAGG
ncbi:hypothetical protein LPJ61_005283 [Coemansia biformis]|uniref:Derlin n=1 Tax=Coemansia biformis TaxID=1286918 RepID=A0A9W8CWS1_9FUNG|nr:hypothetical protein LPJ61_005283 [Coemansia biformis]